METTIFVVTECGKEGSANAMYANEIGCYSTLEKAQEKMLECYNATMDFIKENGMKVVSHEINTHETTILFEGGAYCDTHFVTIDEINIDEDVKDFHYSKN